MKRANVPAVPVSTHRLWWDSGPDGYLAEDTIVTHNKAHNSGTAENPLVLDGEDGEEEADEPEKSELEEIDLSSNPRKKGRKRAPILLFFTEADANDPD